MPPVPPPRVTQRARACSHVDGAGRDQRERWGQQGGRVQGEPVQHALHQPAPAHEDVQQDGGGLPPRAGHPLRHHHPATEQHPQRPPGPAAAGERFQVTQKNRRTIQQYTQMLGFQFHLEFHVLLDLLHFFQDFFFFF